MPPPPLPAVSAAAADAASAPATVHSVEALSSFSDALANFLDQWNSVLADANSIIAALPPVADPVPDSDPTPNPVAEPSRVSQPEDFLRQLNSVLVQATSSSAAAAAFPVTDHVAESSPKPFPVAEPEPNRVAEPEDSIHQRNSVLVDATSIAAGFPVADPVPESEPKPSLMAELEPNRAPEPEPTRQPEPEPKPKPKPKVAPDRERKAGDPSAAVLGNICEQMGSRALRRFVTVHLRDRSWLRRVVPGALRRAPDPAALVLLAVSRYYICCESGDAEIACVLLLELYVRAGCPRRPEQGLGEAELRAEAREATLTWRSRIVREKGRVADASARDGRGLILLMAAFGVPAEFPAQELYELLFAGGGLACAEVLKCSQLFVKKLRDVVADMLNKGSYQEAIAVVLAFELQDAFPLAAILTYIVEKVVHNRKYQESEGQRKLAGTKEHDEEELGLMRSICKYVEEHTPCSSEISCFGIAERIKLLEERVAKPKQAFKERERKKTTEGSLE